MKNNDDNIIIGRKIFLQNSYFSLAIFRKIGYTLYSKLLKQKYYSKLGGLKWRK